MRPPGSLPEACAERCFRRPQRHHRHAVDQELRAGDDDLVAGFQSRRDGIGVAHGIAQRDRRLDGKHVAVLLLRHKDEALPALAGDRQHRNHGHRRRAPDDPRLDHLRVAQHLGRSMHWSLDQDPLQRAVHLRREESRSSSSQAVCRWCPIRSTSSPMAHLAGALGGNVDVGFEILVLIHGGQHAW